MAQLFQKSANSIFRIVLLGVAVTVLGGLGILDRLQRSSWAHGVGDAVHQDVPFSHEHHVGGIGLDCRYCHTSVESGPSAGIPPTSTCINCHKTIWNEAPMLEPVRQSMATGKPLEWNRVHDLPDFVFFNHSVHVAKGVGCVSCHGRVDKMPLMAKSGTLQMSWCLDCHRHPEPNLRPKSEITNMEWAPPADSTEAEKLGQELAKAKGVETLQSCSYCHR